MDTNDADHIVVGEGDETVERWEDDMGAMRDISRLLHQAKEADHEIDWDSLATCLGPLNLVPQQARTIEPSRVHEFLKNHPGVVINSKSSGGDSSGRSGHHIQVKVQADKLLEVSVTIEALASAMYASWESM
ncbi:MAG: hypothetical protein OER86_05765 [Phycisphaerae bacterium]|nr:hypothetical protein [Phycisphaerae bacterium]